MHKKFQRLSFVIIILIYCYSACVPMQHEKPPEIPQPVATISPTSVPSSTSTEAIIQITQTREHSDIKDNSVSNTPIEEVFTSTSTQQSYLPPQNDNGIPSTEKHGKPTKKPREIKSDNSEEPTPTQTAVEQPTEEPTQIINTEMPTIPATETVELEAATETPSSISDDVSDALFNTPPATEETQVASIETPIANDEFQFTSDESMPNETQPELAMENIETTEPPSSEDQSIQESPAETIPSLNPEIISTEINETSTPAPQDTPITDEAVLPAEQENGTAPFVEAPLSPESLVMEKEVTATDEVTATQQMDFSHEPIVYTDDFSSYNPGVPPPGWIQRGTTGITPTIMEIGGTGSVYQLVNFPEVGWQYWDKWLLKEGIVLSNAYTVETQMQFRNSVADRAGLTIAWDDANQNRIDIQPNVYGDDIEFRVAYTGSNPSNPVVTTLSPITINPYVNYWLKVVATDYGPGKGEVEVYWSTDHSHYTHVLHVTGLPDLTGLAGLSTAGPHMPNVYFDNYSSSITECQSTITNLNVCDLQRGDILFYIGNYPPLDQALRMIGGTYWFHSAIYLGGGEVAEATGPSPVSPVDQVSVDNIYASAWWKGGISDWVVIRPVATTETRNQAASYAEGKANQVSPNVLYNTNFFDKDSEDKFYCSQLVWKAYQKQGIDLESNVGIMTTLFGPVVTPDDIFYSISNGKSILAQDSPNSNQKWRAVFRIFSPGHLLLTDLEGRRTGLDPVTMNILNEIPNTYYTGPDADPESIIALYPSLEKDNWVLTVAGTATGEYTLNSELMSKTDLYYAKTVQEQTTLGQMDSYPLINTGLVPLIHQVFIPIISR